MAVTEITVVLEITEMPVPVPIRMRKVCAEGRPPIMCRAATSGSYGMYWILLVRKMENGITWLLWQIWGMGNNVTALDQIREAVRQDRIICSTVCCSREWKAVAAVSAAAGSFGGIDRARRYV